MSFETEVRTAIREIADEGALAGDYAAVAWRHGRRQRARHRAYVSAGTTFAVVAIVGGSALLTGGHGTTQTNPSTASTRPVGPSQVPSRAATGSVRAPGAIAAGGDWVIGGGPSDDGTWVYDRITGRYIDVHHSYAFPAPTGPYVAVEDGGPTAGDQRIGVLDLSDGRTRWIATEQSYLGLDWTADGTRLVYRSMTNFGTTAIHVFDAIAGDDNRLANVPDLGDTGPAWLPGGTEFAIGVDNQGPQTLAQVYDANTGERTGTTIVFGSLSAWSPDGRHVIRASDCAVVDAANHTVVTKLGTNCYGSRMYWAGNDSVISLRYGSKADEGWIRYDLSGTETAVTPMPAEFAVDEPDTYTLVRK